MLHGVAVVNNGCCIVAVNKEQRDWFSVGDMGVHHCHWCKNRAEQNDILILFM